MPPTVISIAALTAFCGFIAYIIYKSSNDDSSGGVGGGGFSTDRPRTQPK